VEVEGTVAPLWSIDEWFDDWLKRAEEEPFLYDNHLCPQSAIVPPEATVFRLEDGLDAIVPHLDRLAGDTSGARSIPAENVRKKGMGPDAERLKPSAETLARVARFYAADFARFGYGEGGLQGSRRRPDREAEMTASRPMPPAPRAPARPFPLTGAAGAMPAE
jgi:hypothetical protein